MKGIHSACVLNNKGAGDAIYILEHFVHVIGMLTMPELWEIYHHP